MFKKLNLSPSLVRDKTIKDLESLNNATQLEVLDANFEAQNNVQKDADRMAQSNKRLLDALNKAGKL